MVADKCPNSPIGLNRPNGPIGPIGPIGPNGLNPNGPNGLNPNGPIAPFPPLALHFPIFLLSLSAIIYVRANN